MVGAEDCEGLRAGNAGVVRTLGGLDSLGGFLGCARSKYLLTENGGALMYESSQG